MIITKLIGGLGNQMFQYALGRALSIKLQSTLYLDITALINPPKDIIPRNYELDKFNIRANIASYDLLKRVPFSPKYMIRIGFQKFFKGKTIFRYVKEQTHNFDKEILGLPDNVYLDGYWQSERYFNDISDIIRDDFLILHNPSEMNRKMLDKIQNCNSVSVHIRRGDYVTNPKTQRVHFVCDEEYYETAFEMIKKQIEKPYFFVFSDDPLWAQNHIVPDGPVTFVSHNTGIQSSEDMRLMMNCKHHIIANSSFSWWGAWLGKKPEQLVIAPGKWFNTKVCNYHDRLPSGWLIADAYEMG
jgi:hypothetical protein